MPILDANTFEFISRSPDQTRRVGMRLGALLQRGDVLCLDGELGSGKTTLVQGLAAGWGSTDLVSSPTFVLVNLYRRSDDQLFAHLDAYRLNSPTEAETLDLDEMLACGPLVIEWAPRICPALPDEYLTILLKWLEEEQRQLLFKASGEHYQTMLDEFQQRIFGGA